MYFLLICAALSRAVCASDYTQPENIPNYLSSLVSKNIPRLPNFNNEPSYPIVVPPELIAVPPNSGNLGKSVPLGTQNEFIKKTIHSEPNLFYQEHSVPPGKSDGSEFELARQTIPRSGNLHLNVPLSKTEDLPNTSHLTVPRPELAPYPNLNKIMDKPLELLPKDILKLPPPLIKDVGFVEPATVKPLPTYSDYAKPDLFKKPDLKDVTDHTKSSKISNELPNFFNMKDVNDHPISTKFPNLNDLPNFFNFLSQLPKLFTPNSPQLPKIPLPDFAQLPDLGKFLPTLPDVPLTKLLPLPNFSNDYPKVQPPDFSKLFFNDLSAHASENSEKIVGHAREKRSYDEKNGVPGMDLIFQAIKMPNLSGWGIPDISKLKDLEIAKLPDIDLAKFIHSQGYPVEVHEIVTEDGYILGTYRIPHGRHSSTNQPNPHPIMINHGLMGSAENYIIGGPEKALPFVLADHGFDVWLMNARGSWHSRKHKYLNPDKDKEFWKFTFHEIGYYDLPATIDYISHVTSQSRMHYIGHSQGTTVFFVMASERPEYNAKIKLMVALAPSVVLKNIPDPTAQWGAPLYPQMLKMIESTKFYESNPPQIITNQVIRSLLRSVCGEKGDPTICLNMFKTMAYGVGDQIDIKTIPLIAATVEGGASSYQSVHFAQIVATGKFSQMDWGEKENLERYHQKYPPEYNLNNVVCPVSLMFSKGDSLIAVKDVMTLAHILPNVVDLYKVPYENWTHMDFVWAKSVDKYINPHVLDLLHKYSE